MKHSLILKLVFLALVAEFEFANVHAATVPQGASHLGLASGDAQPWDIFQGMDETLEFVADQSTQNEAGFNIRNAIEALREAIPPAAIPIIIAGWAKAKEMYPVLAELQAAMQDPQARASLIELMSGFEAMMRVGQEAMQAVMWDKLDPALETALASNVTTQPCTMLSQYDRPMSDLASRVLHASSMNDLANALSQFKAAQKSLRFAGKASDFLMCVSPTAEAQTASLAYLVSQFRGLSFSKDFLERPQVWEAAANNQMREITESVLSFAAKHNASTFDLDNIFDTNNSTDSTTSTDSMSTSALLELSSTTSSTSSPGSTMIMVTLVVLTCLLAMQFYMVNVKQSFFVANTLKLSGTISGVKAWGGMQGYTIDDLILTIGCTGVIFVSMFALVGFVIHRSRNVVRANTLMESVANQLNKLVKQKKRNIYISLLEAALDASPANTANTGIAIRELCEFERYVVASCLINQYYSQQNNRALRSLLEQMKAGESLRNISTKSGKGDIRTYSRDEIEEMNLFHKFFHTTENAVSSSEVFSALAKLGLSDSSARDLVNLMDANLDGSVTFDEFQQQALHNEPVSVISFSRQLSFVTSCVLLILSAMTLVFSTGDPAHGGVALLALFILAIGAVASIANSRRVRSIDPATKLLREKKLAVAMQSITAAFGFIGLFFCVYMVFLKACNNAKIECPNQASFIPDDSVLHSIVEQKVSICRNKIFPPNTTNEGLENYANAFCDRELNVVQPVCIDELDTLPYDKRFNRQCVWNVLCAPDGSTFWVLSSSAFNDVRDYAFAQFNAALSKSDELSHGKALVLDDFASEFTALDEITRRHLPPTTVMCIEQSMPSDVMNLTRIARARSGYLEEILDFGTISTNKEVQYVPWGDSCNNNASGVVVQPYNIVSNLDLAFFTHGRDQRRYSVTVPGRTIGQSYYHMCERQVGGATYTKVSNAVYIFGEAAGCGSPDCSNSDFTAKMDNSFASRLYFTITTAATVGYGDIYPTSRRGRLAVVMHALFMLIVSTLAL